MNRITHILIVAFILLCFTSCTEHKQSIAGSVPLILLPADTVDVVTTENTKTRESRRPCIDKFLDFKYDGTKESFLLEAKKSKIFILKSPDVVNFLGADWGLNVHTDSLGRVERIVLLTSITSKEVFKRAKTELNPYWGEPYEIDELGTRIFWDPPHGFAKFRNVHTEEGGWWLFFTCY